MTFSRRLRQRYWRESTFKGVEMVRSALDEAYGAGKVSLVSAAFRWLQHHSQMKPECNGEGDSLSIIHVDIVENGENGEDLRPFRCARGSYC